MKALYTLQTVTLCLILSTQAFSQNEYGLAHDVVNAGEDGVFELDLATGELADGTPGEYISPVPTAGVVRSLIATDLATASGYQKKYWVYLGGFGTGMHKISITSGGWGSRGSMDVEFSVSWSNPNANITIHSLTRKGEWRVNGKAYGSEVDLYRVPLNGNYNGNLKHAYARVGFAVLLASGDTSGNRKQSLSVIHRCNTFTGWIPTEENNYLTEQQWQGVGSTAWPLIKGIFEQQTGLGRPNGNELIINSSMKVNGTLILENAAGDISMGIFDN